MRLLVLVAFAVGGFCDDLKLVVLHNNDMHSRYEETSQNSGTCKSSEKNVSCYGGFARTAHAIRSFRKSAENGEIPDVLYLNAGDTYTGTTWFSVHKWKIAADFMNILAPDAMSLGNHEFDNGPSGLAPFLSAINFPLLAANINTTKYPDLATIQPSVVVEKQGVKIGIVGYVTPDTVTLSSTGDVQFFSEVTTLKRETERLDALGVKVIIALGHSGYLMDQQIAAEVPLVDVVVGGHTNTFLYNGQPDSEVPEDMYPKVVVQKSGKKVPVVQAYAYTKYLGVLNLTFDSSGDLTDFQGQPILLNSSIPQEEDVLQRLEIYRPEVDALNTQVVGKTKVSLNSDNCRIKECNFGNLIADAFVYYIASSTATNVSWTGAPIAILNGGGVRNSIEPSTRNGDITRGDLLAVLPFDSGLVTMVLSGKELLRTLELGARSNGETSRGEFLQVSGLKYTLDNSKPTMGRISSVKVRCGNCTVPQYTDLDLNVNYTVVTTTFLADGGDGYWNLKDLPRKLEDMNDVDAVQWYLERQPLVYAGLEGRITLSDGSDSSKCSSGSKVHSSWIVAILGVLLLLFGVHL